VTRIRPHNVELDSDFDEDTFDCWDCMNSSCTCHRSVEPDKTPLQELEEAVSVRTTMALALARAGVVSDESVE
jgi:hypothetical protein